MRTPWLLIGGFVCLLLVAAAAGQEIVDQTVDEDVVVPEVDPSLYALDDPFHKLGGEQSQYIAELYRKGVALMEEKDYGAAIKLFNEYLSINPHAFPVNRQLGSCYWLSGKLSLSLYQWGRCIHLADESTGNGRKGRLRVAYGLTADFLIDLAHSFSKVFKTELATLLEKREPLAIAHPLADVVDRVVKAETKDDVVDLADEFYALAMEHLDRKDKVNFKRWGQAIGQHGRYKKAIEVMRQALDHPSNPKDPAKDEDIYKLLADNYKNMHKYEKCVKFATSALNLGAVDVIFLLTDCYSKQLKYQKAWAVLEEAESTYPVISDLPLFVAYKAQLSAAEQKLPEALEYYDYALSVTRESVIQAALYTAKAKLEDASGDYEQAFSDMSIAAQLYFERWLYNDYKPKWKIADKVCPRKKLFVDYIDDHSLISSRKIVHFGDEVYGADVTPLALPTADTSSWTQRINLQFEDRDVHHSIFEYSAVFGYSNLNVQECGILMNYPLDYEEANSIFKVVGQAPKGVLLGPGGDYEDLSHLLLRNLPQLLVMKDADVFADPEMQVIAPETDVINQLLDIAGLSGKACGFEPLITSLYLDEVHVVEFTSSAEEGEFSAIEDSQFVSKWALKRARTALIPQGDLPKSERRKVVVIKTMPKNQLHLNVAKQSLLHDALKEAFDEVVVFNPYSPNFTFEKMQRTFQSAAAIVGPHSSGLSGMIYAAPGTPVIELPVQGGSHNLYANVATALDLPYWIVPSVQSSPSGDYHLTEAQRAEVVATVKAAIDIDGEGIHVPLWSPPTAAHDEL